jgi:ABC-type sugar transport system ATPase subunit
VRQAAEILQITP